MLLPVLVLCTVLEAAQEGSQTLNMAVILKDKLGAETSRVVQFQDPLKTPELSPKKFGNDHWTFDWQTVTYENLIPARPNDPGGKRQFARFYVFSQERSSENDAAFSVARMMERLWEYIYRDLGMDHSTFFGEGVVDVFLCKGGKPGGEQLFGLDEVNGKSPHKVNEIYLYNLPTLKDPLEMAREVANAYGRSTLSGVDGYTTQGGWANGYLGEMVYLKHLADGMASKDLYPDDAMGATQVQIKAWLAKNVNPLVVKAAEVGPNVAAFKQRDQEGMDNFVGMAMYIDTLFPPKVFSRSLQLLPTTKAEDYLDTAPIAVAEPLKPYALKIPSYLAGKPLWLPLGDSRVSGAEVVEQKGDWAKVKQTGTEIQIVPKHSL